MQDDGRTAFAVLTHGTPQGDFDFSLTQSWDRLNPALEVPVPANNPKEVNGFGHQKQDARRGYGASLRDAIWPTHAASWLALNGNAGPASWVDELHKWYNTVRGMPNGKKP